MRTVDVALATRTYPIMVGCGAVGEVPALLPPGVSRVAVVTQRRIPVPMPDFGVPSDVVFIPEGEAAKSFGTVEYLCRTFARVGMTRSDLIVAVGGGVVTDTAGFAAAVYHRGVPVLHVATTLLAQVDAAIGGKTGVNLPEGKNLAGAFWQPVAVVCDTAVLATLPDSEYRSGLGEMAKYQFLGADLECNLDEQVARCVEVKVGFVVADEFETTGRRALLNYGHTLAHALEATTRYEVRHGEAVAIGLVFAAELAAELGRIDEHRVAFHRAVVARWDLPASVPPDVTADDLIQAMRRDKKRDRPGFTFVLDGSGGLELTHGVEEVAVRAALERVGVER